VAVKKPDVLSNDKSYANPARPLCKLSAGGGLVMTQWAKAIPCPPALFWKQSPSFRSRAWMPIAEEPGFIETNDRGIATDARQYDKLKDEPGH